MVYVLTRIAFTQLFFVYFDVIVVDERAYSFVYDACSFYLSQIHILVYCLFLCLRFSVNTIKGQCS